MKEVITFKNVTMSYQTKYERVDLFHHFSLNFQQGEFAVLLGPSGSGKTTLLNLIAGFVKPDSGEIRVHGQNIAQFSENEVCRYRNVNLGFIFQFFNLVYPFNAEENILVPLLLAGVNKSKAKQRVDELLDQVGMSHRKKHYPAELSGGEQQRVAIARALANAPEIILADEPTGNLDKKTGEAILSLLSDIHREGKTIIVVTHDTRIAELATNVYDMEKLLEASAM